MASGVIKNEITDRLAILTGTTSSTQDSTVEVALPSGFTYNNTAILSFMIYDSSTTCRYIVYTNTKPIIASCFLKNNNKLGVIGRTTEGLGKYFVAVVYRYA